MSILDKAQAAHRLPRLQRRA